MKLYTKVTVKNFKGIQSTEIPLDNVTVLVGPNGSGKSSVLQALHWTARSSRYIQYGAGKAIVSFDRLDYLPSKEPLETAYRSRLKNHRDSRPTQVIFHRSALNYINAEGAITRTTPAGVANIRIWAARNSAGISTNIDGPADVVRPFKKLTQNVTAYIPGLAGVSERETILAQPVLRKRAASGDGGSVLRNVLYQIAYKELDDANNLKRFKLGHILTSTGIWLQKVYPGVQLKVTFDEHEHSDIFVEFCDARLRNTFKSLELAPTGLLQVIQIFAYLLYFKPKILLIDEPDSHLHPDKQKKLIECLEEAAVAFNTQIILTTHSPHVVNNIGQNTSLVWMKDGKKIDTGKKEVQLRMGLGGLNSKILFIVEDKIFSSKKFQPIPELLSQWPDLAELVTLMPVNGVEKLPKPELLRSFITNAGLNCPVIIHRDRDFMSDQETQQWKASFDDLENVTAWVTHRWDADWYFTDPNHIAAVYGIAAAEAQGVVDRALTTNADLFNRKRRKSREKFNNTHRVAYADTGAPSVQDITTELGGQGRNIAHGTELLKCVKNILNERGHDAKLIEQKSNVNLAPDLHAAIHASMRD